MNRAVRIIVLSMLVAWSSAAFPRQYVHEHEGVPVSQEAGKEDTVKLEGFQGALVRKTRGCSWVIDDLGALVIDARSRLVCTYPQDQYPCHVLIEDVGKIVNDGVITLQGVVEAKGQLGDGPEAEIVDFLKGPSMDLHNVIYSGAGVFRLPIEEDVAGSIDFEGGRIEEPIRLEFSSAGPLSSSLSFHYVVVQMRDTAIGEKLTGENAVVLAKTDVGGMRLRLHYEERSFTGSGGRKHISRSWRVVTTPQE